jgi:hypothetical protein
MKDKIIEIEKKSSPTGLQLRENTLASGLINRGVTAK